MLEVVFVCEDFFVVKECCSLLGLQVLNLLAKSVVFTAGDFGTVSFGIAVGVELPILLGKLVFFRRNLFQCRGVLVG